MEFVRVIFFYFAKDYEPELAHREATENGTSRLSGNGIYALYVLARDRISKYMNLSVKEKKFGGPGDAVIIDFTKMSLRNLKNARGEEYVILGFKEEKT
jgi:hypothetical protein